MIETIGLWWLVVMSVINIFLSVWMIGRPRKPAGISEASGYILWSLTYIAFYFYLLGAFK